MITKAGNAVEVIEHVTPVFREPPIYSPFRHSAESIARSQNLFEQVALVWILRFGCAKRSMTE
jgi:hypothetical protein